MERLYGHIELDERGIAWLPEANRKVREIALDRIALGLTPEEIREQHPDLTMGQIYAALAYYYDHQAAMDTEIRAGMELAERLRASAGPQVTRAELESRLERRARVA